MKPASPTIIQKELLTLEKKQVVDLCLRLAKYKVENKELLSYLLFDSIDEDKFVANTKKEMSELFSLINTSNLYYTRKGVRKSIAVYQ